MSNIRTYIDLLEMASSYRRVIPRDLFNEANLLKCYGQLYIQLEQGYPGVDLVHNGGAFAITQDPGDGSLYVANVRLDVRGHKQNPRRPLNARTSWPLYIMRPDEEEIEVFTNAGLFSEEMKAYLLGDGSLI